MKKQAKAMHRTARITSVSSENHALLVGVSDYEPIGVSNLPACLNDTEAMNNALQQACYFDATNIQVLKGRVPKADFNTELELMLSLDGDMAVVYFSGHGSLLENGEVNLVLSDGYRSASSIVDLCRKAHKTTWLVFDMCYAGAISFRIEPFSELNAKAGEGCALFASCAPDKFSYIDPGSSCSAFTSMLVEAMDIARCKEGTKSLPDIERALHCLVKTRNQNTSRQQQPLLMHSTAGPIVFHNPNCTPYQWNADQLPKTTAFEVVRIEPCFADRKRYSCKVLAKSLLNRELLIQELPKLISKLQEYEVYDTRLQEQRWKTQQTQVLFIYFAANEDDLINSLFPFCVIWSREGKNEKLRRGTWCDEVQCWIYEQWTSDRLNEMRSFYEKNTISDASAIHLAAESLKETANCASELFAIGDRWLGGIVNIDDFSEAIKSSQEHIEKSLDAALQIGFPSQRLRALEEHIIDLAGALRDLPLFFLGKGRLGRSDENLEQCFIITRRRYDNARMKIAEIIDLELS